MCWLQSVLTTGHLKDFVCLCYLSLQAPSDPRYLWTQFSSVDNLYEPSTEASVPLSTFRSERPSFFSFLPPSSRHFWLSSGFCTSVLSFFAAAFFFEQRICGFALRVGVFVCACVLVEVVSVLRVCMVGLIQCVDLLSDSLRYKTESNTLNLLGLERLSEEGWWWS